MGEVSRQQARADRVDEVTLGIHTDTGAPCRRATPEHRSPRLGREVACNFATVDEESQVLADSDQVGACRCVATPLPDEGCPITADDERGGAITQGNAGLAVREPTAFGRVHHEAPVERCQQQHRCAGGSVSAAGRPRQSSRSFRGPRNVGRRHCGSHSLEKREPSGYVARPAVGVRRASRRPWRPPHGSCRAESGERLGVA